MTPIAEIKKLKEEVGAKAIALVGSTLICGHGKDRDYIALVGIDEEKALEGKGFVAHEVDEEMENLYDSSPFRSWRRGEVNLLTVMDPHYYASEVTIANAAMVINGMRPFNFQKRADRVEFHKRVRMYMTLELPDLEETK